MCQSSCHTYFSAYVVLRPCINECGDNGTGIECIGLPPGFSIDYYAEGVEGARSMALSPEGTLFAGSRGAGKLYAMTDRNGDNKADDVLVIAEGLDMPNGVAFRNGSLYVAEFQGCSGTMISKQDLKILPTLQLSEETSCRQVARLKYIKFGPDGKLYVPVGMPCNVCNLEEEENAMGR